MRMEFGFKGLRESEGARLLLFVGGLFFTARVFDFERFLTGSLAKQVKD
jgi:hypothetical protein